MIDLTPRQAIRHAIKEALSPLVGAVVSDIYHQFDPAADPSPTPWLRLVTVLEDIEQANMDEDERSMQLAVQAVCTSGYEAMPTLERVALAIERQLVDETQFEHYTEHPINGIRLIQTQFPELDDQPNAFMALVYQITYTTQRREV